MVYEFLADGFEIVEAMAPIDMLRRAKIDVKTVGVTGMTVKSSCGIDVCADISINDIDFDADAIILPGGMPGTLNLENNPIVQKAIDTAYNNNKLICAICAAPSILGHKNILVGHEATAFPGFEEALNGAVISEDFVIESGNFITARGAGVATLFALKIVEKLTNKETADSIKATIQYK